MTQWLEAGIVLLLPCLTHLLVEFGTGCDLSEGCWLTPPRGHMAPSEHGNWVPRGSDSGGLGSSCVAFSDLSLEITSILVTDPPRFTGKGWASSVSGRGVRVVL